jgi:putative transposase
MPRESRIDAPGALHHIIARGIARKEIFRDDEDRDNFLDRLCTILKETKTFCYAWALKAQGCDLDRVARRVADLLHIEYD